MFKTYEELKEKFPIGAIYRRVEEGYINYYYNSADIDCYKRTYHKVIIKDNETCLCIERKEYTVEGYLFDGTNWYPARRTWDGWECIDENEINVEGF